MLVLRIPILGFPNHLLSGVRSQVDYQRKPREGGAGQYNLRQSLPYYQDEGGATCSSLLASSKTIKVAIYCRQIVATIEDESDSASDAVEASDDVASTKDEETVAVQTQAVAREQMISWQVWQPALLGLIAAFLSKFLWEDYVYSAIGFDSQWWLDNGIYAPQWWLDNGSLLFSGDILTFLFTLSSLHWYDKWGDRAKMVISASISVNLCLMLLLFSGLLCWPIIILVWVLITVVWGKYRLSPYRTGIWLGVGGGVALILGGIMAHFVL